LRVTTKILDGNARKITRFMYNSELVELT